MWLGKPRQTLLSLALPQILFAQAEFPTCQEEWSRVVSKVIWMKGENNAELIDWAQLNYSNTLNLTNN